MNYQTSVNNFKRDVGVLDTLSIYNANTSSFDLIEGQQELLSFVKAMNQSGCFKELDYSFLDLKGNKFLIYKNEHLILIAMLKKIESINFVLLTIRMKAFIRQLLT